MVMDRLRRDHLGPTMAGRPQGFARPARRLGRRPRRPTEIQLTSVRRRLLVRGRRHLTHRRLVSIGRRCLSRACRFSRHRRRCLIELPQIGQPAARRQRTITRSLMQPFI